MKSILFSAAFLASTALFAQNPPAATPAPAPAAPAAASSDCSVTLEGNDQMQFNIKSITIDLAKCPNFTVELKHVGKIPSSAMGHNWFLANTSDMQALVALSGSASANGFLLTTQAKDPTSKVIAGSTKLLGGGEHETIKFSTAALKKGGDYTYFCTFPGHFALMSGKVVVN